MSTVAAVIDGMHGLGDNIYQRAVLAQYTRERPVYLSTPWPQLYAGLPVYPLQPETRLRTQLKNASRADLQWAQSPARNARRQRWHYQANQRSIVESLADGLGFQLTPPLEFSLPDFGPSPVDGDYVVVRPATIRAEWHAASRNPRPEYIAQAAAAARQRFKVVSVADIVPRVEWEVGPMPPADVKFHGGELRIEQLLALVAGARGVIGGIGWIVPACLATRTPLLLLYGGWGASNGPQRLFGPLVDELAGGIVTALKPQPLCMCNRSDHLCEKTIHEVPRRAEQWVERLAGGARVVS